MLYKFTETKVYYIEAQTEDEALDKYSELHNADLMVEAVPPDEALPADFFNYLDPKEMVRRYGKEYIYHLNSHGNVD